jgi:DNA-binding protein Fis
MNTFESCQADSSQPLLRNAVLEAVQNYFAQLGDTAYDCATKVYELVLAEVEKPLLEAVLAHTKNNQVKSAKLLGISRGTLRKKMKKYGML